MKKNSSTATPETPASNDKPAVTVRVKVLKNGLSIAGCTAAKNATVNCTAEAAKFHEDRGEVAILGTL